MIAAILTGLVAALHLYFLYLEMVAWDTPAGRRAFGTTPEFSAASKTLAANQGLYNGFLAAGLIWGVWLGDAGFAIRNFFLICVIVAGSSERPLMVFRPFSPTENWNLPGGTMRSSL